MCSHPAEGINFRLMCLLRVVQVAAVATSLSPIERSLTVCVCVCVCVCPNVCDLETTRQAA